VVRNPARSRRSYKKYGYATTSALPNIGLRGASAHPSRVLALAMACLMIALMVWFAADLRFYVFAARVQGASVASANEIYRAAGLQGMSIFHVNPGKVAQDIQKQIPGIEQVQVQVALPDQVDLRIREGSVRFIWRTMDASYLVDANGRVLASGDDVPANWVAIVDLDNHPVLPGGTVHKDVLSTVNEVNALLPAVRSFEYSEARGVSALDARGWHICFGDSQDIQRKVAIVRGILSNLEREGRQATLIDVRFPDGAYYQ
jgi:cell division septal protein FtsQ